MRYTGFLCHTVRVTPKHKPMPKRYSEQTTLSPSKTRVGTFAAFAFLFVAGLAWIIYSFVQSSQPTVTNTPKTTADTLITDPVTEFPAQTVSQPGYLTPTLDPNFHTTITRVGGVTGATFSFVQKPSASDTWRAIVKPHYAKDEPWNADQSILEIENTGGQGKTFLEGDANTTTGTNYRPLYVRCSGYTGDDRWVPSVAHKNERVDVISGATTAGLQWFDVTTCTPTRTWNLPFAVDGLGSSEGNVSNDGITPGRFVALGTQTQMFVVDMDPQAPLAPYPSQRIGPAADISNCGRPEGCYVDWVSVSPSGKYVVVSYNEVKDKYDVLRVFDVNPTTLALTPHVYAAGSKTCTETASTSKPDPANGYIFPLGHADMTIENGNDVIVGQLKSTCDEYTKDDVNHYLGSVIKVRLNDDQVISLTNPRNAAGTSSNEADAHHVSLRNYNRPGWAYVTYKNEGGAKFRDEVVAVKLDGSAAAVKSDGSVDTAAVQGSVERIANTHTVFQGCYDCEAHGVPSPDGQRVMFASSWTYNCVTGCGTASDVKPYIIDTRLLRTGTPPGDTTAPTGVDNVSPADQSSSAGTQPTLTAKSVTDPSLPVTYKFELFTGTNCSGTPSQTRDFAATTTWNPSILNGQTVYSWHNRASDGVGNQSVYSPCWSFATSLGTSGYDITPPTGVGNFRPANGAVGVASTDSLWAITLSDPSGPVQYKMELYKGTTCSGTPFQTRGYTDSPFWWPGSMAAGQYAWRTKAEDSALVPNESDFGACTTFTVGSAVVSSNILLTDNFENGATQWTPWSETWNVITDGSKVYKQADGAGDTWSTSGSGNWTDYSVEARLKTVSAASDGFIGLYGRWTNEKNFYYVRVTDSSVTLKKNENGVKTTLKAATVNFTPGSWHTIRLDMKSRSFGVYVDNATTPLLTVTDTTFGKGKVALGTYNAVGEFDLVTVKSLAQTGGGGGGPIRITE